MIIQTIAYKLFGRSALSPGMATARYIASRRAGGLCELSGQVGRLVGHHMFNVSHFPWFATSPWNYIMLRPEIHEDFHRWRGGTSVWCTPMHLWYWWHVVKHPVRTTLLAALFVTATWVFYQWL